MLRPFNMLYRVAVILMLNYGCYCRFIEIDDMKMTEQEFYSIFGKVSPRGLINTKHRYLQKWDTFIKNGQYRIPYSWSGVPKDTKDKISEAFDHFTNESLCFQFVERSDEPQYFSFTVDATGCWSYTGRRDPVAELINTINIQTPGCDHTGIIIHEIMHALGFFHEHQRPDRDDYVLINETNIKSGEENNFRKYLKDIINSMNVGYDFQSIMHYDPYSFSKNGRATIVFANGSQIPTSLFQRSRLTESDKEQLKLLYPCPASKTAPTTTPTATTTVATTEAIETTPIATTTAATTTEVLKTTPTTMPTTKATKTTPATTSTTTETIKTTPSTTSTTTTIEAIKTTSATTTTTATTEDIKTTPSTTSSRTTTTEAIKTSPTTTTTTTSTTEDLKTIPATTITKAIKTTTTTTAATVITKANSRNSSKKINIDSLLYLLLVVTAIAKGNF